MSTETCLPQINPEPLADSTIKSCVLIHATLLPDDGFVWRSGWIAVLSGKLSFVKSSKLLFFAFGKKHCLCWLTGHLIQPWVWFSWPRLGCAWFRNQEVDQFGCSLRKSDCDFWITKVCATGISNLKPFELLTIGRM
jgi:hypothetical protein